MAEILINAKSNEINEYRDSEVSFKNGYIVTARDDGHVWGRMETLPDFIQIKVTDATVSDINSWIESTYGITFEDGHESVEQIWLRCVDFETVSHNVDDDIYRLNLYAKNSSPSGIGAVTRGLVNTHIEDWSGDFVSYSPNSVVFDIGVYNAVTTERFWIYDVSDIYFYELNYDSITGVHRIEMDMSALYNVRNLKQIITQRINIRNGVIISESGFITVVDFHRDDVNSAYKEDIFEELKDKIKIRQFKFTDQDVQDIIDNYNGYKEMSFVEFQGYLKNQANDEG